MSHDARRCRRHAARIPMLLEHDGTKTLVETEDISLSGLCVRSEAPVNVYSIVNVTIPMPSQAPIHLSGMVVHNGGPDRQGNTRPVRIQLHFATDYPADRWKWLVSTIDWRTDPTAPINETPLPGLPRPN